MHVQGFDCICAEAVSVAAHLLHQMLANCDHQMLLRLQQASAALAIIGRTQVTAASAIMPLTLSFASLT